MAKLYGHILTTYMHLVVGLHYGGEKLLNHNGDPEMEIFSESEKEAIVKVGAKLGSLKTNDIIQVSHDELAWQKNIDSRGRISSDYGFLLQHIDF